jgi:hypothetical protein
MFGNWLLVMLAYVWSAFLLALGIHALAMKGHSSRVAALENMYPVLAEMGLYPTK